MVIQVMVVSKSLASCFRVLNIVGEDNKNVSPRGRDNEGHPKSQGVGNVLDQTPSSVSVSSTSANSTCASVLSDYVAGRKRRNHNMCSIKSGKRRKTQTDHVLKQKHRHYVAVSIDESNHVANDNFQPGIYM